MRLSRIMRGKGILPAAHQLVTGAPDGYSELSAPLPPSQPESTGTGDRLQPKVYDPEGALFSYRFIMDCMKDPPSRGQDIVVKSRHLLFFRGDQFRLIAEIGEFLQHVSSCLSPRSQRCDYARAVASVSSKSFFQMLCCLMDDSLKKRSRMSIRCLRCGFCGRIQVPPNLHWLIGNDDISRLKHVLRPQILPPWLPSFGSHAYMVGPYEVRLLEREGALIYLLNITTRERARALKWARWLRREAIEPPSTSLDLGEIIRERRSRIKRISRGSHLESIALYGSVGLGDLYPLLLDEKVSEFYVDKEGSFAYLDHRNYGRCKTSVFVSRSAMDHLITFASSASGRSMSHASPSLRSSIKTPDFHVRVSADMQPLAVEGTTIDVRRFFTLPLDLGDLVKNRTISPGAASYLVSRVRSRSTITIYGESGSGKTTLAVALDLAAPPSWRKISIESDVAENVPQHAFMKNQVRLLASSEDEHARQRRISVLNGLLHKSPDYVFLGEVLSKEDGSALFQILAAGIKGIHTVHADSAESLFRRFVYQYGLNPFSLLDLDVLVHIRKMAEEDSAIVRRVVRISEVCKESPVVEMPRLKDLFVWSPSKCMLEHVSECRQAVPSARRGGVKRHLRAAAAPDLCMGVANGGHPT